MPTKGETFIGRGFGSMQNGAIALFILYITEMLLAGLPGK